MATVAEVCAEHLAFTYEGFDRIVLNSYLPFLQTPGAVARFFRDEWQCPILSPVLFKRITDRFVENVRSFARAKRVPIVPVTDRRKPGEVAQGYLARARRRGRNGVVVIVVHQESAWCFASRRRAGGRKADFEIGRSRRLVNHYYFYLRDPDYGDGFVRICSYLPFPTRIWLNGHGWLEGQLRRRRIGYRMDENSFVAVEDPARLQALAERFGQDEIERCARRWLRALPSPLTPRERRATGLGLSIYQLELCHNQIFRDSRVLNRVFEAVLRDHLHFGRPDMLKLFYQRQIRRNTPSRFATRVLRQGVVSCLKTFYKKSFLKQYNKAGRLLRTELCINDPRDFGIGKSLANLGYLRTVAHHATTRLMKAEAASLHAALDRSIFERMVSPFSAGGGQRIPALRLGTPRAMAVLEALCHVGLLFSAFGNRELRQRVAALLGVPPEEYRAPQMAYDLRKLIGKGLVRKLAGRHRYVLTPIGYRVSLSVLKLYERALIPVLTPLGSARPRWECSHDPIDRALARIDRDFDHLLEVAKIAA